jgi:peroxiredoxin
LLPELELWQQELDGKVDFVYVSRGKGKENEVKFGSDKLILLQKEQELAELVFAKWTPSALLVNAEGRVVSHLAIGDTSIRTLVAGIRSRNLSDDLAHIPLKPNGVPRMIGKTLPEFSLEDRSGRRITNESFRDQPTLITFWSPDCSHCTAMVEQLRNRADLGLPDDLDLVIFSSGKETDHSALNLDLPIVPDAGFKVSNTLGVAGTPSAVLIDENGRIVSETAIGAPNIWSLVRRPKV